MNESVSPQGIDAGRGKELVRIRVLLADDHAAVREVLADFVRSQPDLELVAEAQNGRRALALARDLRPDVVLMDISMPGLSGIETTRLLHQDLPGIAVIGLSMHDDPALEQTMLDSGASGFVRKDAPSVEWISAIRKASKRE